jgi:hypothetical protein
MKNLSFKTTLWLMVGSAVIGLLTFGSVVFSTLSKVQIGSPTYKQIVMIKDVNADYVAPAQSLAVAVMPAVKMEGASDPATLQHFLERLQKGRRGADCDRTAQPDGYAAPRSGWSVQGRGQEQPAT